MMKDPHAPIADTLQEDSFEQERERIHLQMLSSVSHDLKTPLAAVIGSLEIYRRMGHSLPEEKGKQLISTALMEAYRLDNFVTNILDMAKLENGLVKTCKERCDLEVLLRECTERMGSHFKKSDVKIIPFGRIILDTDPALFCRIIGVLIDNAIKYGGAIPEIWVKAWQENNTVFVQVADNGPGIPLGKTEEIFSKYTRIKRGDHQNAGTGLGLAIGRALASLLGGKLYAENQDHGGALFTLEIAQMEIEAISI